MQLRFILFTGLAFFIGIQQLHAQGKTGNYKPINLDSLSADDMALFVQYKDSFKHELDDFLFVIGGIQKKYDTTVYNMDRSSHAEVGMDFISRILVNGREVGITGVGFFPSVGYYHKSGFYIGLGTGFYTYLPIVKATPVPLVIPALGYQHTFFKRWFVAVGLSHTFVTYGSAASRLIMCNGFSAATSVDIWKHLIVSVAGSLNVTTRPRRYPAYERYSAEVVLGLRKEFIIYKFIGAKVFTITPALNFIFATDNQAFGRLIAVGDVNKDTGIKRQVALGIDNYFGFVDLEPQLTIDWRIRNLDIFATPALAIPFNTFNTDTRVRTLNPKQYRFYIQAGIKYLFCIKKKHK